MVRVIADVRARYRDGRDSDEMTLLLTWVAPDGIVMGADSALTFSAQDKITMTLADAYKVIPYDRKDKVFGLAFHGLAKLHNDWTSTWLRNYISKCKPPETIGSFVEQLAADLNALNLQDKEVLGIHVAGWEVVEQNEAGIIPRFMEVTNAKETGEIGPYFSAREMLGPDFIEDIRTYRGGDKSIYPMRFASSGVPIGFSTDWIAQVFIPAQTKMLGVQVPQPHITSVAEYVRFLISMVADTQRVTRQYATVNRPIETLLLFPDLKQAFSTRY